MNVWLWRRLRAAGMLVGVPGVLLGQQGKAPSKNPEVVRLTVTGVHAVDQGDLLLGLAIAQSHCRGMALIPVCWISKSSTFFEREYLNRTELARDVIRARVYYYRRGYREATVDTIVQTVGKGAVKVTLAVHEGAPTIVEAVRIVQTDTVLTRRDLQGRVRVRVGAPLNQYDMDSTRMQLRNQLWEKGFSDAIVDTSTVIDTTARHATVTMKITPRWVSRVGTITVKGNDKVSTPTIMKSLSLHPSGVYRRSDVVESQRSLYQSNLFRRASIDVPRVTRRQAPDSVKSVTVTVQEAPPRTMSVSAGFNTVDFAQVEGRYTDYNWYGGARQLNLLLTVGNLFARQLNGNGIFYDITKTVVGAGEGKYYLPSFEASGEIRQPWFRSPNNDVALSLFTHRRVSPGIYVDRGYGSGLTFTRLIGTKLTASLGYRFEVTNVDAGDLYFCVSSGVCDAPTLAALHKNETLSPVALSLATDHTDDPYEPRTGYKARLDIEHASSYTLSDFRYNRVSNEESAYLPLARKSVLAGHFQVGYVSALASTADAVGDTLAGAGGILHPRKRLYLGGAASVRGFAENQLGPRVLTISQSELRGNPANSSQNACAANVPITQCSPNVSYIKDADFEPRALGGNQLLEASVEYRFPVVGNFLASLFVDAGYLGQNTDTTLARHQAAVTPGFGVRYLSPAGPIRVDIGINPVTTERLPVVTESYVNGQTTLVTLQERRTYHPVNGFLSRLMLHLAIGEAY